MKRISFLILSVFLAASVTDLTSATTAHTNATSQAPQQKKQEPLQHKPAPPLSTQAQISLLTCSPSEDNVYTVYGHTGLRIYDPALRFDKVFNYGIFDSSKPNFIYRFAKGETDYKLQSYDFKYYLIEYLERGSEVYEQVLNLLPEEKEALWQALVWNELPENRSYRYNFFFDNCATRPVEMIEKSLRDTIRYAPQAGHPTFRDAINNCTRYRPWQTFGCDLIMGTPTDRTMTLKETFFLPDYLKEAFDKAEIVRNGQAVSLVAKVNILNPETQTKPTPSPLTSPLVCFTLYFLFILAITWYEWRRKTYDRWVDCILFFIAGIAGCILFFLSFMSVHPCMFPNISLLWLHPIHLLGVVFFSVKKFNNIAFWYHFINFAVIFGMAVVWCFIPQHFNIAFVPLIASLWLRSGWALIRKKESIG